LIPSTIAFRTCSGVSLDMTSSLSFATNIQKHFPSRRQAVGFS
jgi:hypothetical protein